MHIQKAGKEIIIVLGDENNPLSIRDVIGMSRKDTRKAISIVYTHQEYVLERWGNIHG